MTRALILITGFAGFGIVARAAAYYRGVDELAFGVTLIMGAALLAGVVELWFRAGSIAGLQQGLRALPERPENLEGTSADLRALLRSHLERDPMPTKAPTFTPYLVGLLVMLGLLGTFLGLFETLRGAREALSSSGDVDALRAGLTTPMAGLMRSFGTSAAGVASSAMLGLGSVFTLRAARRLDRSVHHACSHSLAHLSAARRQLDALEALAEQGEALPSAAAALRDAVASLKNLGDATAERAKAEQSAIADQGLKLATAVREELSSVAARLDTLDAHASERASEGQAQMNAGVQRIADHLLTLETSADERMKASQVALDARTDRVVERFDSLEANASRRAQESQAALEMRTEESSERVQRAHHELLERVAEVDTQWRTVSQQSAQNFDALAAELSGHAKAQIDEARALLQATNKAAAQDRDAAKAAAEQASNQSRQAMDQSVEVLASRLDVLGAAFGEARRSDAELFAERSEALLSRIASLETGLGAAHAAAAAEVREVMAEGIAEAAKAAAETVEPTVQRIVTATERSAAQHLDALRSQLDGEQDARRGRDAESLNTMREHLDQVVAALDAAREERGRADAEASLATAQLAEQILKRLEDESKAHGAASEALLAAMREQTVAAQEVVQSKSEAILGRLAEEATARAEAEQRSFDALRQHVEVVESAQAARAASEAEHWQAAATRWASLLDRAQQADGARAGELASLTEKVREQLDSAAATMRDALESEAARDELRGTQLQAMTRAFQETHALLQTAAGEHGKAVEALASSAQKRADDVDARSEARVQTLLDGIAHSMAEQTERLAAFEATLATRNDAHAATLSDQLAKEAERLGAGLDSTGEMVRDAAALVKASGGELSAAVEMFTGAVEQHGEAAQRWLGGLAQVERSVEEAGEEAAVEVLGQYLARTHELFDQQLGFQQELYEQLKLAQGGPDAHA